MSASQGNTMFAWFLTADETGLNNVELAVEPDVDAGNRKFFDPNPECLIQLRPMLKTDVAPHGAGRRSNALLYAHDGHGVSFVCYVRMPAQYRKNNRACISRALDQVRRFAPNHASQLDAIASRTQWPTRGAWSWERQPNHRDALLYDPP
ncbi:hypothetical protein LOK46_07630 [Methylobacterium sp. NMS14P]|uniref:hypothetical protein n=1 Tax=Methylobacterium sp. NMS14P TaxID=2894310 RepID=UPI00235A07F9|nr:hypothetical protein [Methylobacterium sp. NMS14P]WCS26688.1 hypothetical protein LOK46_07630 [Methylobacterium sp. NMS14P]